MTRYFLTWLAVTAAFLAIDFVWLAYVARNFYRERLAGLLLDTFRLEYAAGFYLIYTIGIIALAVVPAVRSGNPWQAVLLGALFGLCAYGTYDMTNLATLRGYSGIVAAVDMAWGTFLTATAAFVGYQVLSRL